MVKSTLPFRLGLTLPVEWRRLLPLEKLLPSGKGMYDFLGETAPAYVEFGFGLALDTNDEVLDLLRRESIECRRDGLGVAIHPGPGQVDNDTAAWFGDTPRSQPGVRPVVEAGRCVAESTGAGVSVVVHPAQFVYDCDPGEAADIRRRLVGRSRLFFTEFGRQTSCTQPAVRPLAEYQLPPDAGEPLIRVGDTCRELMEVATGANVGICWDVGHYILSLERYGGPEPPPPEFLSLVSHVHLHDVVGGCDHRPVTRSSKRLEALMRALLDAGFTGDVTLEYALDGVLEFGGVQPVLAETHAALSAWCPSR